MKTSIHLKLRGAPACGAGRKHFGRPIMTTDFRQVRCSRCERTDIYRAIEQRTLKGART